MPDFRQHWLSYVMGAALIAIAAFLFAPKVKAADKGGPPPNIIADVPVAKATWTGVYVSGYYGYGSADAALSSGGFGIDGFALTGQIGGIAAGADWQVPGSFLVLGARGGYQWNREKFSVSPGLFGVSIDDGWTADGRIGAAFGTALPYVFVGRTVVHTSTSIVGFSSPDLSGWRYGAGVELRLPKLDTSMFTPTVALEGVYTDYDSKTIGGVKVDVTDVAVIGRLNLKFGRDATPAPLK